MLRASPLNAFITTVPAEHLLDVAVDVAQVFLLLLEVDLCERLTMDRP
jgi:hypothetical protein